MGETVGLVEEMKTVTSAGNMETKDKIPVPAPDIAIIIDGRPSPPEPAAPVIGMREKSLSAATAKRLALAEEEQNPALDPDASFLDWLPAVIKDSLLYPVRGQGWAAIIPGGILSALVSIGAIVPGLGIYALGFSLGYFGAFYLKIIGTSMGGGNTLPEWPKLSRYSEDISSPAVQVAGVSLISYAPLIVYSIVYPEASRSPMITRLLETYGFFYHPMACISLVMDCGFTVAMPHKVLPAIFRCLPGYLVCVVGVAVVLLIPPSRSTASIVPYLLQTFLLAIGSLYISVVQARITGLTGRRYRDRIGWG